jgi:hypothetical protein
VTTTDKGVATPELDDALRARLAEFADVLIAGGAGLPSASEAGVQGKWIDRTLAARPDLVEVIHAVIARAGDPSAELDRVRTEEPLLFDRFTHAIAGAYLMVPRVRKGLGLPGNAPKRKPAYPDEADHYLSDGVLDPVIERGPIYRPTPDATT